MVTITDAPIVVPEIEKIIKLNGLENKNVLAKPLDWENRLEKLYHTKKIIFNLSQFIYLFIYLFIYFRKDYIPFLIDKGPWDFILAADVVWVDYLIVPLVDSIDGKLMTH
jgi:hypothetical protein